MQLSFSTLSFDHWTVEQIIQHSKRWGYTGIELREGSVGFSAKETPGKERREIRSRLEHEGIAVTDIGASIFLLGKSQEEYDLMMKELLETQAMARDFGARGIRVFLGNMESRIDKPREAVGYERLVQWLREACGRLAGDGIEIWIETHNEFSTGRKLSMLLRDTGMSNCKVIWDVLHPIEQGEQPADTLNYLGKACAHVHVKDGVPHDDILENNWKYTRIGQGKLPLKEIMELLREEGYAGFLSLEWEAKWKPELQVPGCEPERAFEEFARYAASINAAPIKDEHQPGGH